MRFLLRLLADRDSTLAAADLTLSQIDSFLSCYLPNARVDPRMPVSLAWDAHRVSLEPGPLLRERLSELASRPEAAILGGRARFLGYLEEVREALWEYRRQGWLCAAFYLEWLESRPAVSFSRIRRPAGKPARPGPCRPPFSFPVTASTGLP